MCLRSPYFHTSLQHCSNVGRLAFLDAQKNMNTINTIANTIMEEDGPISYIVELLEDPEDAVDNLKPELEKVKDKATKSRELCEDIKKKFEFWHLMIDHLGLVALNLGSQYQ
jgi:hypothetical protein